MSQHDRTPLPENPQSHRRVAVNRNRALFRHVHVPHRERVEVAVLGALGRLARRLGDSPPAVAR